MPLLFFSPAIVLLCLLEVAFVQANDYSWGGPGKNTENVDPNTENGKRVLARQVKAQDVVCVSASYLQPNVILCVCAQCVLRTRRRVAAV